MNGRKIKLLWIGDSPAVTTGFGRVSQGVLEGLQNTGKYQISVLGINHPIGDPHRYEGMMRIYPAKAKGHVYGFERVGEVINKETPDIILINNDLWIIAEYLKNVIKDNKVIAYAPVDALPVQKSWMEIIDKINIQLVTYTEFAREGIALEYKKDIRIIGHGVDTDEFYQIDDARDILKNVPKEAFVVQNVNRNQPRKRLDLFLRAMQLWLARKSRSDRDNIFIYYHGILKDVGWNIVTLASRWGVDDKLLITDQNGLTASEGVSIQGLNRIYNCADVHVMTSMGEGFGLSPFESAATRTAQVLPNHSACGELWKNTAPLVDVDYWEVLPGGINTEGGVISVEHLVETLDDLYMNRDKLTNYADMAYDLSQTEQYTWTYIANQFDALIEEVLGSDMVSIDPIKLTEPDTPAKKGKNFGKEK